MKKKKNENVTIALVLIPVVIAVFFLVGNSLSEIKNTTSLHEDNNVLLTENDSSTQNIRQKITAPWDPEVLTAQLIERTLTYGSKEGTIKELKNIENNIMYNRNKVAVLFYLAYGYERIKDFEQATKLYKRIRADFFNNQTALYIFNVPRVGADDRNYSVDAHHEALMRLFLITNNSAILNNLRSSTARFGVYKKEKFAYRDLYEVNSLQGQGLPFSSAQQFLRLAVAKKAIKNFMLEVFNGQPIDNATEAFTEEFNHPVSVSIGVYIMPGDSQEDLYDAVKKADDAVYKAKENGRNQVVRLP